MDRGEARALALGLRAWQADVDDDFEEEINTFAITPAVRRLAADVPEAVLPSEETVVVLSERTTKSLGRTVAATADPYVLDLGLDTLAGAAAIAVDGTWDGIFHIEVTSADGKKVSRRQCREFWLPGAGTKKDHYLVSIDRPWPNSTDTGLSFRLYQPYMFTRADVTRLLDGRTYNLSRQMVGILPAASLRRNGEENYQGLTKGPPLAFVREERWWLDAPNRAPRAASVALPAWQSDQEPTGTFEYCYTYVWGRIGSEFVAPGGVQDPVWESAASPTSGPVTVTYPNSVYVTNLTNIAWQMRFDPTDPAMLRNGRTGLRKRIYRKRTAVSAGGTTEQNVEIGGIWYFLAEVEDDVTTYVDDGSIIPDYHRRLPENKGYWRWAVYPEPDQDYEVDLRVLRKPATLQNDQDIVPFDAAFEDVFTLLVLHYICQIDKDPAAAATYLAEYEKRVGAFRAEQASSSDYIPGQSWAPGTLPTKTAALRFIPPS